MANHIKVKIKPDSSYKDIEARVVSKVEGKDEEFFDFAKIVPPPENIEKGNCPGPEKHKEGEVCWYQWNIENWGTKWNSYRYDKYAHYDEEFAFETAWSHPEPVIAALSKMYPDVEFDVRYADEDLTGENHGEYKIKNGAVTFQRTFSSEDERELFARRLRD